MSASYARHNAGPAPRAIIRMGPEHTVVGTLELDDVDWKIRNELEPLFGIPPNIWVQSQCSADDFKTYIPSETVTRVLARNLNVPYDVDAALWRILDNLRMNVAGGVIIKDSFLVLIYPAGMEGWNFLDTGGGGAQSSSGTKLKCQIFRLDPAYFNLIKEDNVKILRSRTERQPSPSLSYNHHLPNVFKHLFGIEMKNLLPKATRDKSVDNFFLIFPSAISEERKLYVDLLTKSGAKVILHEDPPDTAWQYFRSHYDHGVVLIHPSFTSIHRIPKLVQLMRKNFTIFEFGINTDPTTTTPTGFTCTRLFPHGGAVLITDALIMEAPIDAFTFVSWFAKMLKCRAPNTWKLVGRPGLKDWVLSIANANASEEIKAKGGSSSSSIDNNKLSESTLAQYKIYLLLDELLPESLMTHTTDDEPPRPTDEAPIMWEDLPGYGNGQRDVGKHLAEWFCGWALTKRKQYRRFVIVDHTAPDSLKFSDAVDVVTFQGWKATYT